MILWTNIELTIKDLLFVAVFSILIYVIIKRLAWARTATIVLLLLGVITSSKELISFGNFLIKYYNPTNMALYCATMLIPTIHIIISTMIIIYLVKVKDFFTK